MFVCMMIKCLQAKAEDTLDLCELLNNDLAKSVASCPDRFVGLGTLPLQAPELAVKELIRCKKELGTHSAVVFLFYIFNMCLKKNSVF